MSTSNSNSPAILESCQKRLKSADPSLQSAVRFSALATAFLGSSSQSYGNVRVIGGDAYTRKAALLYFLSRVAEKSGLKPNDKDKVRSLLNNSTVRIHFVCIELIFRQFLKWLKDRKSRKPVNQPL